MVLGLILRSTLPFLKGVCKFLHRVSAWLLSRYSGFVQTGNSKSSTGVSASVKRLYLLALHRTAASSKVCNCTCNPETAVTDSLRPRVPEPTTADDEGSAIHNLNVNKVAGHCCSCWRHPSIHLLSITAAALRVKGGTGVHAGCLGSQPVQFNG